MSESKDLPAHLWSKSTDFTTYYPANMVMESAFRQVIEYSGEPPIMSSAGTKHDSDKPDLSLVSRISLEQEARALQFGEKKYGRYNYVKGFESSRLIAACLRHVVAWQDGEDKDPESGLSHLAHAKACLGMLLHIEQLGTLTDNRLTKKETK